MKVKTYLISLKNSIERRERVMAECRERTVCLKV